jgi:penicillin-binding protein 1A
MSPTEREPASAPRRRLVLDGVRPPRRWWAKLLVALAFLGLLGATAAGLGVLGVYLKYADGLPDIPKVNEYWPAVLSEVFTDDGVLAGEFYNERRKVVPYERIPKRLVQAFIASEDASFFDHGGVDFVGTTRAAIKTAMKKATGSGSVQGGSTLTQQTAKAVLVTAEMRQLNSEEISREAERRVPPVKAPSETEISAEAEVLKQERQARILPGGKGTPPELEPAALRQDAAARLTRRAEQERQERLKEAFLRVREQRKREAFQKATAKKMERKLREAILARRLEAALTKEEILYLYLNNVYLGHHAYGVQSAAENYFRKDVRDLSLAQMTLIAGLPQAPSRFSPFRNPEAAKKRRSYVLRRMLEEGMITRAEHDEAAATEVQVHPVEDVFREFAPYFVEQVRKDVVERYGSSVLLNEGLRLFTTMDSERQRAAQEAMFYGLLAVDKRQGYRGPLQNLADPKDRAAFVERSKKAMGAEPIVEGRFYVGLVTALAEDGLSADVQVGPHRGKLPLLGMRWARKVNADSYYSGNGMLSSVKRAVQPFDLVVLRAISNPKQLYDDEVQQDSSLLKKLPEGVQLFRLEQEPELQGALVSIDPHRQYLSAMVGGYDFDANEFNRAFQACRQPGSSFKPLVYAAALEQLDWTSATVLVDSPIVFDDPESQLRWKPDNFTEEFKGDVLLRTALVNSMNIPAVKAFQAVGVHPMAEWSKKLGLSSPMNLDFSAALGSSCVIPYELANVYATFDRYGNKRPTFFTRKIEDRFGRTVEDHTAYDDPWAPLLDRLGGGYARLLDRGEQVMRPENGFIMVDLMRAVVREGTGAPANRLGKPAAGKTGTTNDSYDAWFAGFTRDLVTVSWVGYDLNTHPLGRYETGGRAALPIWLSYMRRALDGVPQGEFFPAGWMALVRHRIDKNTGRIAAAGSKHAVDMWFRKGTAPKEVEPDKNQIDPSRFMMSDQY